MVSTVQKSPEHFNPITKCYNTPMPNRQPELNPIELHKKMMSFAQAGPSGGVNNFILSGPVESVPTEFWSATGIFDPGAIGPNESIATTTGIENFDSSEFYSRLMHLQISEALRKENIRELRVMQYTLRRQFHRLGYPFIVAALGNRMNDEQEVIL
jgi:hypothetical protein